MKKEVVKNIIAFFLVCLFVFNGLCSSFPAMFSDNEIVVENLLNPEAEKKTNNEKAEQEPKEVYLNNVCPPYLLSASFFPWIKILTPITVSLKEDVSLSIPTPPPKAC